jgi:hypothetical protein
MVAMANQRPESDDDFIRMQQEAIRRVREMQSRARATLENAGMHIENHSDMPADPPVQGFSMPTPQRATENDRPVEPEEIEPFEHEAENKPVEPKIENERVEHKSGENNGEKHNDSLGALSQLIHNPMINLKLGSDQIMLMILIYLLVNDGADKWLILSLAYVLIT